jgi:hypothetical protein
MGMQIRRSSSRRAPGGREAVNTAHWKSRKARDLIDDFKDFDLLEAEGLCTREDRIAGHDSPVHLDCARAAAAARVIRALVRDRKHANAAG